MIIYLSAAPEVRRFCLPPLISGFEAEVQDNVVALPIVALQPVHPQANLLLAVAAKVRLEARDTGRRYRDLPWWEVRRVEDWVDG